MLQRVSIFGSLADHELDDLLAATTTRRLATGEELFRKGDPGNQLYGVLEGRLKVTASGTDGREVVFGYQGPGDVIGEIALIDQHPRSASAIAMEPTQLLTLHRRDLVPFLERHPKVAIQLAAALAAKLRRLSEHTEDALFLTLPSRMAKKLLSLAERYGVEGEQGLTIDIRLPQQELADLVGTTRESVNKQLRAWESEGLVRLERARVTLLRPAALESLASFVRL